MLDLNTLLAFSVAALALLVLPGPAVLYIVARSLHQGRLAGLVSVLGVQSGGLLHVLAATVGLSAIVLSSALLFSLVKFAGASYLIYLGVKTMWSRGEVHEAALPEPRSLWDVYRQGALVMSSALLFMALKVVGAAYLIFLGLRTMLSRQEALDVPVVATQTPTQAYWQGALVNALNPKTALFFLAFLPQFVNPARGSVAAQTLLLGLLFLALATLSDGTYALLAGTLGTRLRGSPRLMSRQKYVTGGIYVALGVGAATVGRH